MKRYVLVGTGSRGYGMYAKAITERFGDCAALVGLYDKNPKRSRYVASCLKESVPVYDDFDEMLKEAKPDCVIITTMDCYHHEYVVRTLDKGIDVICEKPLTMDAPKCREILEAEQRNNRKIAVTFNCRFMPTFAKVKEILQSGAIGEILHVDFEWLLDTSHGADYFRRWHRKLENCGGLMVHKATHHFDIINWLIEQDPVTVYANGALQYYGKDRRPHGERCSTCPERGHCEYVFQSDSPQIKGMYFDCEDVDHYYRDRCIFDNEINIYDTMSLSVRYSAGALMTYSLTAHNPYEGWKLAIAGSKGRLEASEYYSGLDKDDPFFHVDVFDRRGERIRWDIRKGSGMHGGGDDRMLGMLLRGVEADPLGQCAGSRDGCMSALIGIAANESIKSGLPVTIRDLVDVDAYIK